jgi:hypothetical protein
MAVLRMRRSATILWYATLRFSCMNRQWPVLAEAVEKVGCQVARGFALFDFAQDKWHQRSCQRSYAPSGKGFGSR